MLRRYHALLLSYYFDFHQGNLTRIMISLFSVWVFPSNRVDSPILYPEALG